MNKNVEKYKELCKQEPSIPLFSQAWWLDATAGSYQWDVALVEKDNLIVASLPYLIKKRYGFTLLSQPMLTQTLGPWLRNLEGKSWSKLSQQKEWMEGLIDQLPAFDFYNQSWHFSNTNWIPFYWKGFKQHTNYTYILHDLKDEEELWKNLRSNIKSDIKKAREKTKLQILENPSIDDFLSLNKKTFQRQGMAPPYSDDFVHSLDKECIQRNARKIIIAADEEGRHHAGAYIVWDQNSAYYLMGGGDPELRNSGATSLCMWEAIKFAATVSQRFDFEGSMIEPVERFFRAFGASQTPYFSVHKTPSRLLRTIKFLQNLKAN